MFGNILNIFANLINSSNHFPRTILDTKSPSLWNKAEYLAINWTEIQELMH